MQIFNDDNYDNLFTLAIRRNNPKIILEMMKNLCLSQELLVDVYVMISLRDVIKKNNAHTEPLTKNSMVPVVSDNSE